VGTSWTITSHIAHMGYDLYYTSWNYSLQETEASISKAREVYRLVATRGSLVYFLMDSLCNLDRVYHYSMANFVQVR